MTEKIQETIDAIDVVVGELNFHAGRLKTHVEADTEGERGHLEDIQRGYANAAHYLGILRKYQEGRLRREGGRGGAIPRATIDEEGR